MPGTTTTRGTGAQSRRYVSIEDVAETYGLNTKTIRRRIADGTLPAFRIGGRIRLDAAAAERALLEPMNPAATLLLKAGEVA